MIREPGFYWVKWKDKWTISEYEADVSGVYSFWMYGCECKYYDHDFKEINENKITNSYE